ncbi:hypothetical protein BKA70DRAFT_1424654 [Coprinopsis sp. MPI-PUGE-AT-0042]|nr:hypothetical protein BKA70DRAFT_1424654 [Coprinopsis sp. MPI-PUGE-AT-0042]
MGASEIPPERDCAYLSNRRASPQYPDRATCEAGNNIRDAVPASTSTSIQAIGTPGRQPPASDQQSRKRSDCHTRPILHSATDNQKEQLDREIWEAVSTLFYGSIGPQPSTTSLAVFSLETKLSEIHEVFQDNEAWCEAGQSNLRATFDDRENWLESVVEQKSDKSLMQYIAELEVALMQTKQDLEIERLQLQQEKVDDLAMEDIDRVCHDEEVQKEKEETLGLRGGDGGLRAETEVDIAAGIDLFAAMPKEACGRRQALQVCERKMWREEQAILKLKDWILGYYQSVDEQEQPHLLLPTQVP